MTDDVADSPRLAATLNERHPLKDALLLSGSVIVALGLARFSYGLVLPSMREDLGLSFARSGGLGAANTFGYFVGVLTLPWLLSRIPERTALLGGSAGVTLMLFATPLMSTYPWLTLTRFSSGLLGASANLVGLSLAAKLVTRHRSALVVFNSGAGLGIIAAGSVLPSLLATDPDRWRIAWLILGGLGIAATIACSLARTDIGTPDTGTPDTGSSSAARPPVDSQQLANHDSASTLPSLRWLVSSYVCFGSGYIVYITFLIATLRNRSISTPLVSAAFVLIGVCCLISPLLWTRLQHRLQPPNLLAISLGGIAIAGVLLTLRGTWAVFVSVTTFGFSFMASPTFVVSTIRSLRPQNMWATTISRVTIPFAIGQAIAPYLSGAGVDRFGTNFSPWWTVACCTLGSLLALAQAKTQPS